MRWLLLALLLVLTGCAQQRLAGRQCPLAIYPIDTRATAEAAGLGQKQDFSTVLGQALIGSASREAARGADAKPVEHLVLSGGGKWGSFGAGYLDAWPNRPERFQVVTGVSTGALQGTFALLPGRVKDLPSAYTLSRPEDIAKSNGGMLGAVRHGSAGSLSPLRDWLAARIDEKTFLDVGRAYGEGRRFFVGLVDMDQGSAFAVDMTQLAAQALAPNAPRTALRDCYLDLLVAASSEPLAAQPVFVNVTPLTTDGAAIHGNRMLMDAGIRYGIFLQEVLETAKKVETQGKHFNTSIFVNGDQTVSDYATSQSPDAQDWREKWTLLSLLSRAKEMLVHQIYEFSIRRVRDHAQGPSGGLLRLVYARNPDDHVSQAGRCGDIQAAEAAAKVKGFPPKFMRCLIDYGRYRAERCEWDVLRGPDAVVRRERDACNRGRKA